MKLKAKTFFVAGLSCALMFPNVMYAAQPDEPIAANSASLVQPLADADPVIPEDDDKRVENPEDPQSIYEYYRDNYHQNDPQAISLEWCKKLVKVVYGDGKLEEDNNKLAAFLGISPADFATIRKSRVDYLKEVTTGNVTNKHKITDDLLKIYILATTDKAYVDAIQKKIDALEELKNDDTNDKAALDAQIQKLEQIIKDNKTVGSFSTIGNNPALDTIIEDLKAADNMKSNPPKAAPQTATTDKLDTAIQAAQALQLDPQDDFDKALQAKLDEAVQLKNSNPQADQQTAVDEMAAALQDLVAKRPSYEKIKALLAKAATTSTEGMTENTTNRFNNTVAKAKAALPNAATMEQKALENLEQALYQAVNNLVKRLDTSELEKALAEMPKEFDPSVDQETIDYLKDLMADAKVMIDDKNLGEAEGALEQLNSFIQELKVAIAQYNLEVLIAKAEKLEREDKTPTSVKNLDEKIAAAKEVVKQLNDGTELTPEDVDQAIQTLNTAVSDLQKQVDKQPINEALQKVPTTYDKNLSDYANKIEEAKKEAETILKDAELADTADNQAKVKQAAAKLTSAINDYNEALKEQEAKAEAQKTLTETIQQAQKEPTEGKSSESVKALKEAIKKAETIAKKSEATSTELKQAIADLKKAITKFKNPTVSYLPGIITEADKETQFIVIKPNPLNPLNASATQPVARTGEALPLTGAAIMLLGGTAIALKKRFEK